jgi:hypothetical protein
MCGASSTQEHLQAAQTQMYDEMSSQYKIIFGESQDILKSLTASFAPILAAGINQKVFSDAELNNLNAQAVTGTGTNYKNAAAALSKQQGAEGGGTSYIPTGAKMQQQQQLAASAAENESGIESNILAADYQQGRENYMEAASVLGGVAGQYNPSGFANATTGAGSAASTTANEVTQANQSWMQLATGAMGAAATAFCPARGSMYLMADGTERPVETLEIGDQLAGIDSEPQIIEEIQSAVTPVLKVITENGWIARNSRVHAFALPSGGFTVAMYSLGKAVVTRSGPSKVIAVKWDGNDEVFNVITNGSHTYRADGIWALGVGEAERQVSMDHWNKIGDAIAAN